MAGIVTGSLSMSDVFHGLRFARTEAAGHQAGKITDSPLTPRSRHETRLSPIFGTPPHLAENWPKPDPRSGEFLSPRHQPFVDPLAVPSSTLGWPRGWLGRRDRGRTSRSFLDRVLFVTAAAKVNIRAEPCRPPAMLLIWRHACDVQAAACSEWPRALSPPTALPSHAVIVFDPRCFRQWFSRCLVHQDSALRGEISMSLPDRTTFETAYSGQAPWDIGRPQPALVDRADQITGSILDAGCGTGDNALYFAGRGPPGNGHRFSCRADRQGEAEGGRAGLCRSIFWS